MNITRKFSPDATVETFETKNGVTRRVSPKKVPKTFAVAYRTGTPSDCEWIRVLTQYPTRDLAQQSANGIERMGYKALVYDWDALNSIGLPEGWEA